MRICILVIMAALVANPLVAETLAVPGDFPNLRAAIDGAVSGDVIEIAAGVYSGPDNTEISVGGLAVTVRGVGSPEDVVIDATGAAFGFRFADGESSDSVLEGLTVTGAERAVICEGSAPLIRNVVMTGNRGATSLSSGAGLTSLAASPVLVDCRLEGNQAAGGAGIFIRGGSPLLISCQVQGNVAFVNDGGGVWADAGVFVNCLLANNRAINSGGAALIDDSGSTPVSFINCTLVQNRSWSGGGGIRSIGGGVEVLNCILEHNVCTICDPNEAQIGGLPADVRVAYSNVAGGYPGKEILSAPSLFVDRVGPDGDPNTWQDNDLRLSGDSPCIDVGELAALATDLLDLDADGDTTEPVPFDLSGNGRVADDPAVRGRGEGKGRLDQGCFEYQRCLGDLDEDGVVHLSDLATLLSRFGKAGPLPPSAGDLDGDGEVQLEDLERLIERFGQRCP